jgi:hypothetical protein
MSLDTRVRDDLRAAGEQMVDPPLNLAGVIKRGRRRKTVRLVASGVAAAALLTGAAILIQRTDAQPPVVTNPTPTTNAQQPVVTDPTATTTGGPISSDGWIVYQAGPLDEEPFGADIFIVKEGVAPHPLLGESNGLKQLCPVFSPDGTRLAYLEIVGSDGQSSDLVVIDIDGAGEIVESLRLPVAALSLDCPRWSPDGGLIAYSKVRPFGGVHGLVAVKPSVGALEVNQLAPQIINDEEWPSQGFEWSPAGDLIAIPLDHSVWVAPLDPEADPYELTSGFDCSGRNCVSSVSWSPDGSRLAVAGRGADGSCLLKIVPVDGGAESELAECQAVYGRDVYAIEIAWSPDGRWIAYSESRPFRENEPVIFLVSPDTGEALEFRNPGRYPVSGPTWSPDGTQVLYWAGVDATDGFELLLQTITGALPPVVLASDPEPEQEDPGSETTGTPAPTPARQLSWQPVLP